MNFGVFLGEFGISMAAVGAEGGGGFIHLRILMGILCN